MDRLFFGLPIAFNDYEAVTINSANQPGIVNGIRLDTDLGCVQYSVEFVWGTVWTPHEDELGMFRTHEGSHEYNEAWFYADELTLR